MGGAPTGGFPGAVPAGLSTSDFQPKALVKWKLSCWLQAPTVRYSMPNGHPFGTSKPASVFFGNTHVLYDCRGNAKYDVEERVYREAGEADPNACEKYGSCSGVVYVQYIIRDHGDGSILARTPYLTLFQDSFVVEDAAAAEIAVVSRLGVWNPMDGRCGEERKWVISFPPRENAAGPFATPSSQWPIAEMVAIMSIRDSHRRPSGLVAPSGCEIRQAAFSVVLLVFLALCLCGVTLVFLRHWLVPLREQLFDLEERVCLPAMRKPSKYEDG